MGGGKGVIEPDPLARGERDPQVPLARRYIHAPAIALPCPDVSGGAGTGRTLEWPARECREGLGLPPPVNSPPASFPPDKGSLMVGPRSGDPGGQRASEMGGVIALASAPTWPMAAALQAKP